MTRPDGHPVPPAIALVACLALVACGGGGGGSSAPLPVTIAPLGDVQGAGDDGGGVVGSIDDEAGRPKLRVDSRRLCQDAGSTFELPVSLGAPPVEGAGERRDVSARVVPTPSLGDSLELVAQGDEALSLRLSRRDVVRLRLELDDPREAAGLTVFLAAFTPDTPRSVLMRKRVPGGCAYALRLPDVGFCSATWSRYADGERDPLALGSSGIIAEIDACDYTLPPGVAFVELPPEPGADIGVP